MCEVPKPTLGQRGRPWPKPSPVRRPVLGSDMHKWVDDEWDLKKWYNKHHNICYYQCYMIILFLG